LPTAELLCGKYKVHVPDMVGHGSSSKPKRTLSVPEQAAVLAEYLSNNNINRAVVLANSYGCEVAVHLSAHYPELVERLILIGPTCDRSRPHLFLQFLRLCADGFYEHPSMFLVLLKDLWEMGIIRAIKTSQIMLNYKTLDQVPKVKCKTLVVRGSNDTIAPEDWVHKVVRAFKAEVKYVPVIGAPHNVNYTNADILKDVVEDFLNDRVIENVPKASN
jgi:pimeloyl-ACP methyl ester carboxylesterase